MAPAGMAWVAMVTLARNELRRNWRSLAVLGLMMGLVLQRLGDDRIVAVTVAQVTPVRGGGREVLAYALTPVKGSVGWTRSSGGCR